MLLAYLTLSLWGCGKGKEAPPKGSSKAEKGKAQRVDRNLVVARVDEAKITVGRLEDELNKLHPSLRVRFSSPARQKEFLKNLVRFEVLAKEARRRKLDTDPDVIRRVKRAMIDVMMTQLRSTLVKLEDITDKDVEDYYNKHIKIFRQPPKVRGSIIMTETRAEAAKLLAQAKKKSGDVKFFAELATRHSVHPATKVRRGDLGFFTREHKKIPKEIIEAVFDIKALWAFAGPIQTGQKWAILLKTGDVTGVDKPLRMERDRIRNRLFNERRLQAVERFVKDLQSKAKIEILDGNLKKVQLKNAPHPPSSMTPHGPH
jgi:peptidyl-prolyl cis-trans isomerase C